MARTRRGPQTIFLKKKIRDLAVAPAFARLSGVRLQQDACCCATALMAGQRHERMAGWTGRTVGLAQPSASPTGDVGKIGLRLRAAACAGHIGFLTTGTRTEVPGRHVTSQQKRLFMKFRPPPSPAHRGGQGRVQRANRLAAWRHIGIWCRSQPANRSAKGPDPFDGLWDSEIRPMLEAHPGLRPVRVLEEMQRRHPDHDWDRLRRSLERRVRAWRPNTAPIAGDLPSGPRPGQQALSDFTDMADAGVSIAGQTLDHRLYHFVLAYSAWEHAEPVLGGESFTALAVGLRQR